jgi:Cu/Zn superoxide dismutase
MNRIKGAFASLALVSALVFALGGTSYGQSNFTARLTGAQEAPFPGVATAAVGSGSFVLIPGGLQFYLTVEGLSGPITAADFEDAPPGMLGPTVRDILTEFGGTHTAAGLWSTSDTQALTSTLVSELVEGNVCVNIHTAANPAGEIRGQVQLSSGVHFTANLQPTQVNPPSGATGTGAGTFTLTDQSLFYKITVTGLGTPITGASIRTSAIGVNGPITFPIGATFVGTSAEGFINLTPADRMALLAGDMYVNIETGPFPAGQIRGQLDLAGGFGFTIKLDGSQETPANPSPGLGTASATLTSAGLLLDLSASGLTGGITGAHLHDAPAGVPGPIVRDIMPDFISPTSALTLWRSDDPMPMTPALLKELLNNNIYVNLHTAAFPGGEIRGQLVLNTPAPAPMATYTANLTGPQEEPPTGAPGLGTGTFQLTPGGLTFRVTVDGLTGPITAAHFHNAAIGVSGAVVRPMAAAELIGPNTFAGVWTPADPSPFTAALMTELFKGNIYFNVHTGAFPGGEIRGQLLPASGAEFEARLTSGQETPPNGTTGLGTGSFTLTPHGLAFNITADGLSGAITGAHFHSSPRGVGGPVVRGFTAAEFITPTTLAGVWKPTDASPLTPALVTELLKGNVYVNLHTAAFPGGEIRGQLTLSGGIAEGARPVGSQETPAVVTPGKATAAMTLTDEGHVFRFSANDMTGLPTAAHFHDAPVGVPGPVVRPIYATETLGSESADGVWKTSDADPLTTGLLGEMVIENLYLNLHTALNPGGEIRGQLGSPQSTVGVGETPIRGSALRLSSAPNPATDGATISFFLPRRSEVSLRVFDVTGAEVARLVHGMRDGGWHQVSFDTARLSNGVYFFDLDAGGARANRKLLVIR